MLFGVTIIALDATFQRSTERALEELLDAQLLGLIALAEPDAELGLTLPEDPADSRFNVADSGLYGALWNGAGARIWQSLSLLDRQIDPGALPEPGQRRFTDIVMPGLAPARGLLMGIAWEYADGKVETYTFGAMVSLEPYTARQQSFRRNLIGWFAGISLTMLVVIAGLLGFVLRPVGRLERQVREVEAGQRSQLSGRVPTELKGLAGNLNALIDTERRRQVRYRNTLDDLAHSLKTPLAVMRTLLGDSGRLETTEDAELIQAVDRMEERVTYQLRRARASGSTGLGTEPVKVAPVLEDLRLTLDKVYRDKGIRADIDVSQDVVFPGDAGDFTEIAGNLIENAYKYGRTQVRVRARNEAGALTLVVEDDGPGISADDAEVLMERGSRADESVPGQGIGLAVVREIAALYQGQVDVSASSLGGAKITLELRRVSYAVSFQ